MGARSEGPVPGWHYGLDPAATFLVVRSLTRVEHPLGEALRIELAPGRELPDDAAIHVQWYIATDIGPWAMWTAGPPADIAVREAALRAMPVALPDTVDDPPGSSTSAFTSVLTGWTRRGH